MKQLLGFGFLIFVCMLLGYFDELSPRAVRCKERGGKYDVLPGGYGECYVVTVKQISLD